MIEILILTAALGAAPCENGVCDRPILSAPRKVLEVTVEAFVPESKPVRTFVRNRRPLVRVAEFVKSRPVRRWARSR